MFETNFFGIIGINQTFLPLLRKAQGTMLYVGTAGAISPVLLAISLYRIKSCAVRLM